MTMNSTGSNEVIADILLDIPNGYESKIRQFSDAQCNDYSIPLQLIHSFVMQAEDNPNGTKDLGRFQSTPEFQAIVDIVESEPMNDVFKVSPDSAVLEFSERFSVEQRTELSRYIASRTGGIE